MSGPSLRRDLVTGRYVLVAPERRGSPRDFGVSAVVRDASTCPFCPGREADTATTLAERLDADGAWRARAFANRFPMVRRDASHEPAAHETAPVVASAGAHEVVVETPVHGVDLADLDDAHGASVFDLYRERLAAMAAEAHARAALMFKNRGPRSGASLHHAHGQVLSLPVVPPAVARRDRVSARHFARHGRGSLAEARDRELDAGARVVELTDRFVAYCPFAPHRSFETWIVPRFPSPAFDVLDHDAIAAFAALLLRTLRRVLRATGGSDYNLSLRAPALRHRGAPWALWHLEILPRRGGDAGFELTSGIQCVLTPPEESAAVLRDLSPTPNGCTVPAAGGSVAPCSREATEPPRPTR